MAVLFAPSSFYVVIRLLAETEILQDANPRLSSAAAKHLKVVRPKDGEDVELFDGKGRTRLYRYRKTALNSGLEAAGEVVLHAPSPVKTTLFVCITKGARWDWMVEKATEIGVGRIVPVVSARTIVRIKAEDRGIKRLRWQRIAEEAAGQSDAKYVPEILAAVDFSDALELAEKTECFIGALTSPPSPPLLAALSGKARRCGEVSLFIGPEGDFTSDELAQLMKVATPASFGPSVLRAETAAIFALSVVSASVHSRVFQ